MLVYEERNSARRAAIQRELDALRAAIVAWLGLRRDRDADEHGLRLGRHDSQLRSLESVLLTAADSLAAGLGALEIAQPASSFYAECRRFQRAVVWLRRLWDYFAAKFDQRDERAPLGPLLRAADDVVWSCYRQVFARMPAVVQPPPPLVYVEAEYSPAAVQAHSVPLGLQRDADLAVLEPYLRSLPIALVRLPRACVESPWLLIHVAHEVGHHVQGDLGLVGVVRERLECAARSANCQDDSVKTWGSWGEEIFADVFSLMMMGHWALWAVAEEEWGPPEQMVRPKQAYPAPVVRLALMQRVASELGLPSNGVLPPGPRLEEIAVSSLRAERDLDVLEAVTAALLGPLGPRQTQLRQVCGFDPANFAEPGGKVTRWAGILRGGELRIEPSLEAPRQVVSAAYATWARGGVAEPENLSGRMQSAIKNSSPPGTRHGDVDAADLSRIGQRLVEDLLAMAVEGN